MAEDRTFTLIGNFTDNITPKLRSINEQITALNGTIAKFKENGRSLSKEFGSVATSLNAVSTAARANRIALRNTTEDLERQLNLWKKLGAEQGRASKYAPPRIREGGGGGPGGPNGPGPGNIGGGYSGVSAGVFGVTLGNTLSNILTTSIVGGFRAGVNLMQKPFQAAANAFGERIKDETTDIQAAGGLFAVSQRKGLNLFPDFNSAMRMQQQINYKLSQSAAALPGPTEEYVRQGKLLTDTMIQVLAKNKAETVKFSQTLGADGTDKDALSTIVQKFTEKAVLLGQGSTTRSVLGVPQLTERLVNAQTVTEKMFNKYAAFINNPLLANLFREMQPKLAKTAAGGAERLRLTYELLNAALPNEVIQAYKSSVAGTFENLRSLLFSPEVGIFGLGRKMKNIAPEVDQYGRYINAQGQIVNSMNEAAKVSLGIFDLLKDIIVGFGNPLSELIGILPQIFDPLKAIGLDLVGLRNTAQAFYRSFHEYSAYFAQLGKTLGSFNISSTSGARGALAAINNLLRGLGLITDVQFKDTGTQLLSRFANLSEIGYELIGKVINSPFMAQIGEVIGRVIGDTLNMVAKLLGGATDLATAGPFAQGLKAGFDAVKGSEAVATIFQRIFDLIVKGIITVFQAAPLQMSILGGLVLFGPAIAAALGTALVQAIPRLLLGGGAAVGDDLLAAGGKGLAAGGAAAGGSSLTKLFGATATTAAALGARQAVKDTTLGLGKIFAAATPPRIVNAVEAAAGAAKGVARFLPGRVPLIGAGVDVGLRMMQGQGVAKSLGGGAANLAGAGIGGFLGTLIAPGIGTAIGAAAGSFLTGYLYDNVVGAFDGTKAREEAAANKQEIAAGIQKQAAELQAQASKVSRVGTKGDYFFGQTKEFVTRLKLLGIGGPKATAAEKAYLGRNVAAETADAAVQKLNAQITAFLAARPNATPEQIKAFAKPFQDDVNRAKTALDQKQTILNKAMSELGPKANDALIRSIAATPFSRLDAALAAKVNQIQINAGKAAAEAAAAGYRGGKYIPPGTGTGTGTGQGSGAAGAPNMLTYAGSSNPHFASSLGSALAIENAHKPPGSSLVIANSSETIIPAAAMGYFPSASLIGDRTSNRSQQTSVNAPITIYQQPGQSPKELAAMVAMEISNAVADVRNSSYYV